MAKKASIKRRPDGLYHRSITIGRKPDGRPIRKSIYAKTIKELETRAAEYERQFRHGTLSSNEKITFMELAAVWVADYTPDASEKTRNEYGGLIKNYLNPVIGGYRVIDLKKHDLQAILNGMAEDELSRSTMSKVKIVAASVLALGVDTDILIRNVFSGVKVPDAGRRSASPHGQQRRLLVETWKATGWDYRRCL